MIHQFYLPLITHFFPQTVNTADVLAVSPHKHIAGVTMATRELPDTSLDVIMHFYMQNSH